MSLEEKIQTELKTALKAGQKETVTTLRTLLAKIKDERIKLRTKRELTEDDVMSVLLTAVKRHKESIGMYEKGSRPDLAEKEKNEIIILQKYLPEQLSEEDIKKAVAETIKETGAESIKDMGKVMGPIMGRLKGMADGKIVQNIVRQLLS